MTTLFALRLQQAFGSCSFVKDVFVQYSLSLALVAALVLALALALALALVVVLVLALSALQGCRAYTDTYTETV